MSREAFVDIMKSNPKNVSRDFLNVRDFPFYCHKYIQQSKTVDNRDRYECKSVSNRFLNLDVMKQPESTRSSKRKEISSKYNFCIHAFEQSAFILRIQNRKSGVCARWCKFYID